MDEFEFWDGPQPRHIQLSSRHICQTLVSTSSWILLAQAQWADAIWMRANSGENILSSVPRDNISTTSSAHKSIKKPPLTSQNRSSSVNPGPTSIPPILKSGLEKLSMHFWSLSCWSSVNAGPGGAVGRAGDVMGRRWMVDICIGAADQDARLSPPPVRKRRQPLSASHAYRRVTPLNRSPLSALLIVFGPESIQVPSATAPNRGTSACPSEAKAYAASQAQKKS